jgi:transposase
MSTSYFSEALMQEMLYLSNLREIEQLNEEIAELKAAIFSRQKKHRRCDKEISKNFNVRFLLFLVCPLLTSLCF